MSLRTFLKVEKNRLSFCKTEDLKSGKWQKNIDYILESIAEMNHVLGERGIDFVVAIYPDEFQVNPELLNQVTDEFELDPEDYEITCMQRILHQFLEENQISYIDLLEPVKQKQQQQHLYLLQEPHWNSAGNQLASEVLFENVVEKTDLFFRQLQ